MKHNDDEQLKLWLSLIKQYDEGRRDFTKVELLTSNKPGCTLAHYIAEKEIPSTDPEVLNTATDNGVTVLMTLHEFGIIKDDDPLILKGMYPETIKSPITDTDYTLEELREIARTMVDCHVIERTLMEYKETS